MRQFYLVISIFVFLVTPGLHGADTPFEFGSITADEMDLAYFRDKYPGEAALIIGDVGESRFRVNPENNRFQYVFTREVRYIILDEAGLDMSVFSIPFYAPPSGREDLSSFRAHIYRLDGNRVRRSRIRAREAEEVELGNNWKAHKFTFAEAEPGSVLELRYEIVSDYLYTLRSWKFQHEVPVKHSEYNVRLPSFFEYMARFRGFFELDMKEEHHSIESFRLGQRVRGYGTDTYGRTYSITESVTHFSYVAKDVEGLKKQAHTDMLENYLGKLFMEMISIEVPESEAVIPNLDIILDIEATQYTSSWRHVANYMLEHAHFGRFVEEAREHSLALLDQQSFDNEMDAVDYALEKISNGIRWNQYVSCYARNSPRRVLNNGEGNSAEVNLMLLALLRNLGIEAYPVVVSTVDNGALFGDDPTIRQWNYVVVQVRTAGKEPFLLDATVERPVVAYLPARAINGRGRIIDHSVSEWVNLETRTTSNRSRSYNLSLNEKGELSGRLHFVYEGLGAFNIIQEIAAHGEDHLMYLLEQHTGAQISEPEYVFHNGDTISMIIHADLQIPVYAKIKDNQLMLPALLFETTTEHPFTSEERLYPIIFPDKGTTMIEFNIATPDHMNVSYLPEPKRTRWLRSEYDLAFSETGDGVSVMLINHRDSRSVGAGQYLNFRTYMQRFVDDNMDDIILGQ